MPFSLTRRNVFTHSSIRPIRSRFNDITNDQTSISFNSALPLFPSTNFIYCPSNFTSDISTRAAQTTPIAIQTLNSDYPTSIRNSQTSEKGINPFLRPSSFVNSI